MRTWILAVGVIGAMVGAQAPIPSVGVFNAIDGSLVRPSRSYILDPDLGSRRLGANNEGFVAGAVDIFDYSTTRVSMNVPVKQTGANLQAATWQQATASVTCNSGTGTCTSSNLIPAGSLVIGVTARVTTILAGAGLTTWTLGDGSDADRWGATLALAAGTTVTLANTTITTVPLYAAATNVVLTAAAGQFDSGVVRLTVHYISLTAPTS
jgi:hypothetical protein